MEKGCVLLVEDNEDDVFLTKRAFKKKNILHELVVAKDGQMALDYLLGENGREALFPLLILLDLNLPKIDGIQVLEKIKITEALLGIPVVVLTTSTQENDITNSYKKGANSFLRKPIDFIQFSNLLEQLTAYWLVLNEPKP